MKLFLSVVIAVCLTSPIAVVAPPPPVVAAERNRYIDILKQWSEMMTILAVPTVVVLAFVDLKTGMAAAEIKKGVTDLEVKTDALAKVMEKVVEEFRCDRRAFEERLFNLALAHNPPSSSKEREG
jgi:hypothetical protein